MNKHLPLHRCESPVGRLKRLSRKQWVLVACIVTLLFVVLRSGNHESTDVGKRNPTPLRMDWSAWPTTDLTGPNEETSIFSHSQFDADAVQDSGDADLKPVTAVVYRVSNNVQNIINTVHHLTKYPFFQEIYIHSPMGMPKLTVEDLQVDADQVNVHLFDETNERLGSLARFTTCAMATNEYCYFQNDKWHNLHLDSLYLNFVRYPNLIHATAPPASYLDQLRWRMTNPEVSMHAGYAELQYGAFAPRWKAQTFMTQLGKSSLIKDRLRMADMYFSLWTNQYPWLLSNPVEVASENTDAIYTWPGNLRSNLNQAARKLYHTLETTTEETPKDYFERPEEVPYLDERDVRASCKSDRCLFTTNIDFLPDPSSLHFTNANYSGIPEYEEMYNSLAQTPSSEFWDAHGYYMAVDQDPATCWNSFQNPGSNSYFGLLLMGDLNVQSVDILTRNNVDQAKEFFQVSVTANGTEWETCVTTAASTSWQNSLTNLHLELECGDLSARAIRFYFTNDQTEPFNVCGMTLDAFSV